MGVYGICTGYLNFKKLLALVVAVVLLISIVYITPISALNETTSFTISDMQGKYKTQGRTAVIDDAIMLDHSASGIEFTATFGGDVTFEVNATTKTGGGVEGCYFRECSCSGSNDKN